jgi:hypothetical protein
MSMKRITYDDIKQVIETKRYYIHATGSTCYDRTGVTYPQPHKAIDFNKLVKSCGGQWLRWQRKFGWHNQPDVLTFAATEREAQKIQAELTALAPHCFLVHFKTGEWS